jgi:hypothetical protein
VLDSSCFNSTRGNSRNRHALANLPRDFDFTTKAPMPRLAGVGHPTVEATPSIDVMRWHRLGYLNKPVSFGWSWQSNGVIVASIRVATERNRAMLRYRAQSVDTKWKDLEQRILIAWTPCRFGGERPWFRCSCGRHVVPTLLRRPAIRLPAMLWFRLCQPAGRTERPKPHSSAENPGTAWRRCQRAQPVAVEAFRDALANL